ncbi:MAG: hypothetical protein IJN29_10600 [Akkermansia sp.]|nr:hypothetical protein [Akkermansia sp.]
MRKENKSLEIKTKRHNEESLCAESFVEYQGTKKCSCKIEISLKEYGELVKRAMKEGSTPEAMVARRIAEMVGEENP